MSMTIEEKMDDLERRVFALEARTRSSIWSKISIHAPAQGATAKLAKTPNEFCNK